MYSNTNSWCFGLKAVIVKHTEALFQSLLVVSVKGQPELQSYTSRNLEFNQLIQNIEAGGKST